MARLASRGGGDRGRNMEQVNISPRSKLICLLLCLFVGWFGAHRFYTGKIGTGILMLLTTGGAIVATVWPLGGIWVVIDLIFIISGAFRDKEGRRVEHWLEQA
ncbi:MAG: TM2 domain-containing protein [Candidatus Omnitrophica bacterium]|nr:TM2 domain-containing protein [Candidatus Omnitrophota bacterium]